MPFLPGQRETKEQKGITFCTNGNKEQKTIIFLQMVSQTLLATTLPWANMFKGFQWLNSVVC